MSEFGDAETPTHEPLDVDLLWDLSEKIDEASPDGRLSHALLTRVAGEAGVPVSSVYTAAAFDPDYTWDQGSERLLTVCLGACQAWGAKELVDELLELRSARLQGGKASFDLVSVGCLDRCHSAIAAESRGPNGCHHHAGLRLGMAEELVSALCDS